MSLHNYDSHLLTHTNSQLFLNLDNIGSENTVQLEYEIGDYRRSPSTRFLNGVLRRKVIMSRQDSSQFLDPEENSQCMLDMDLYPEWEALNKRKEEQRSSE